MGRDAAFDDNVVSLDAHRAESERPPFAEWATEIYPHDHLALLNQRHGERRSSASLRAYRPVIDAVVAYVDALAAGDVARVAVARDTALMTIERTDDEHDHQVVINDMLRVAVPAGFSLAAGALADLVGQFEARRATTSAAARKAEATLTIAITHLDRVDRVASAPARWSRSVARFEADDPYGAGFELLDTLEDLVAFDPALAADAHYTAARAALTSGNPSLAAQFAQGARSLFDHIGDADGIAAAADVEGVALTHAGHVEDALAALEVSRDTFLQAGYFDRAQRESVAIARLHLGADDTAAAEAELASAWIRHIAVDPAPGEYSVELARASVAVASRQSMPAAADAFRQIVDIDQAWGVLGAIPDREAGPVALAAVAHTLEAYGDASLAAEHWLAATYAWKDDGEIHSATLALDAYGRAATEAGVSTRIVDAVTSSAGAGLARTLTVVRTPDR